MLASKELNVLQTINITMGATAFISLGENLAKAFGAGEAPSIASSAPAAITTAPPHVAVLYILLLLFWTAKLFVENHNGFAKSGERPAYAVFQMFATIVAFMVLIGAAASIGSFKVSLLLLSIHFAALVIWLIVMPIWRSFDGSLDWSQYPVVWFVSAAINGVAAALLWCGSGRQSSTLQIGLLGLMLAVALLDAILSKTFTKTPPGATG